MSLLCVYSLIMTYLTLDTTQLTCSPATQYLPHPTSLDLICISLCQAKQSCLNNNGILPTHTHTCTQLTTDCVRECADMVLYVSVDKWIVVLMVSWDKITCPFSSRCQILFQKTLKSLWQQCMYAHVCCSNILYSFTVVQCFQQVFVWFQQIVVMLILHRKFANWPHPPASSRGFVWLLSMPCDFLMWIILGVPVLKAWKIYSSLSVRAVCSHEWFDWRLCSRCCRVMVALSSLFEGCVCVCVCVCVRINLVWGVHAQVCVTEKQHTVTTIT